MRKSTAAHFILILTQPFALLAVSPQIRDLFTLYTKKIVVMKFKFSSIQLLLMGLVLSVSFTSCLEDECNSTQTFVRWDPVFRTIEDLRTDITSEEPREIQEPGAIFYHNGYLLINEINQGFHVIDNRNPESPVNVSFINVPGSRDVSVKGNILYVDMFMDLISMDISNPLEAVLLEREPEVFTSFFSQGPDNMLIVDWIETEETIEIDCNSNWWGWRSFELDNNIFVDQSTPASEVITPSGSSQNVSVAGSLSRFASSGDFLYAINRQSLETFDISNGIEHLGTTEVSWGIETLFPMRGNLFIGADAGMFIYSLEDPGSPQFMSEFVHARACDPVFVVDNTAFVTLRDGNRCAGFINQLDIIDVTDLRNPSLIRSHEMDNPHGLSVTADELYLCEGEHGVKIFDASEATEGQITLMDEIRDLHAYDVIHLDAINLTMVMGQDGLHQYDSSDPNELQQLSFIPVNRL